MTDEARGNIYYGLHFYPGLAQYDEPNGDSFKVYLTEETLRAMDPTFAGCPVFLMHVDEVEPIIDELRKEADGWVVESFFNPADGKHWVKFIVVSERAERAIQRGMSLSNCYVPKTFGAPGTWNGIPYDKEITGAVYEHLAIVPNPRYEESVILTPDQFKKHNETQVSELKKLANHKSQGESKMKFSFFKRAKVENSQDLEAMSVVLPKSKLEVSIERLINDADEKEMKKAEPVVAQGHHLVDCNGKTMTVNEMLEEHKKMKDAMEAMKKDDSMKDDDDEMMDEESPEQKREEKEEYHDDDDSQDLEVAKKPVPKSDDDKADAKRSLKLEKEEEQEVKDAKRKNALAKAKALMNAGPKEEQAPGKTLELAATQVARGKAMFGSGK